MVEEELTIKSTEREYVRSAWLIEGPKTDHSLCVLLDGEHYRDSVHALPIFLDADAARKHSADDLGLRVAWGGRGSALGLRL